MTLELKRIELLENRRDSPIEQLTIFPINGSRGEEYSPESDERSSSYKHWSLRTTNGAAGRNNAPEITYHCIYCGQCFVNLLEIYDHINNQHGDITVIDQPQHYSNHTTTENEKIDNDDDNIDYSWVLEPICELIDLGKYYV